MEHPWSPQRHRKVQLPITVPRPVAVEYLFVSDALLEECLGEHSLAARTFGRDIHDRCREELGELRALMQARGVRLLPYSEAEWTYFSSHLSSEHTKELREALVAAFGEWC